MEFIKWWKCLNANVELLEAECRIIWKSEIPGEAIFTGGPLRFRNYCYQILLVKMWKTSPFGPGPVIVKHSQTLLFNREWCLESENFPADNLWNLFPTGERNSARIQALPGLYYLRKINSEQGTRIQGNRFEHIADRKSTRRLRGMETYSGGRIETLIRSTSPHHRPPKRQWLHEKIVESSLLPLSFHHNIKSLVL